MASSEEFVQYVVGQLDEAGCIIYKKLFGEYGLQYEGKFFGTVEELDDKAFLAELVRATCSELPASKPRKSKAQKTKSEGPECKKAVSKR